MRRKNIQARNIRNKPLIRRRGVSSKLRCQVFPVVSCDSRNEFPPPLVERNPASEPHNLTKFLQWTIQLLGSNRNAFIHWQ
jgi:RNA recognition motif-containing protein